MGNISPREYQETDRYTYEVHLVSVDEDGRQTMYHESYRSYYALPYNEMEGPDLDEFGKMIDAELKKVKGHTYRYPEEDPYYGQEYGYA